MGRKSGNKINKYILQIVIVGILVICSVFIAFQLNYTRIYDLVLKKDVEQMVSTSRFVTKLVDSEIKKQISDLRAGTREFRKYDDVSKMSVIEELQTLCKDLNFQKLGAANLQGYYVDSNGETGKVKDQELLEYALQGKSYVSDVVDESDCMIIAVPILNKELEPIGALWGYYRVASIAADIELNYDSYRYFQIVDDCGKYISDSNNVHSFARNNNIWVELQQYELSDEITVEEIKQTVAKGESGQFHFTYQGEGRYVYYEPLGINNWYVFSVLVEDYLMDYVSDIETAFYQLIWWILISIIIVLAVIGSIVYKATSYIKKQKELLESKNALLFMTLKHTNDIPFEIDLNKGTISIYFARPQEKNVVLQLSDYEPEKMFEKGLVDEKSYESFKQVFNNMMNLKPTELVPIRLKINGVWDINQIHYEIIEQNKIIGCLEDYNEQAMQNAKMKEIHKKSQIDSLTMLYNREGFSNIVEQKLASPMEKEDGYSALFLLDLDCFKQANDTLGHIEGDQILKESAAILKTITRKSDICGRLGGDELVLYIENAKDLDAIRSCAQKINTALKHTYENGDKNVTISASIGIAIRNQETKFEELYQLADMALYKVKEKGRDGFEIAEKRFVLSES